MTQYVHRVWRTDDGLPQISVMSMAQTPDGYLWIATGNGLARFDGAKFTNFNHHNTPQLRATSITALRTSHDGSLWIGTSSGLAVYHNGRFQALGKREGIPLAAVYALYESRSGEMWVGCTGAVYHGRHGRFVKQELPVPGDVLSITETSDGIWIGAYGGLFRLVGSSVTALTVAQGLPDDNVLIVEPRGEELWIGTMRGVARWHDGAIHRDVPPALRDAEVWSILIDHQGTWWFGTRHGLVRMRGDVIEAYTVKEGLSNDSIDCLLEDRDGSLWVGTHLGGLNHFHDGPFITYSAAEGLKPEPVWSVLDDPRAGIFIGGDGGLSLLANGRLKTIDVPVKTIYSIARTGDGTLWVGSWDGGLLRQRAGGWTKITKTDGLAGTGITSLEADGNTLWVGTSSGLSRVDDGRITTFTTKDGLAAQYVIATLRDRRGRFWVATDAGLYRLQGNRFVAEINGRPLPAKTTFCIHEDRNGVIWFGTKAGLLSIAPDGSMRLLTTRDGLPEDGIVHIEQDRDGELWLVCNRGIFRAREPNVLFGAADGFKSAECTYGTNPSTAVARDGSIWFPTINGAARLDPTAAKTRPPSLLPRIEDVIADGQARMPLAPIDLPAGTEKLEFDYTAPSFIAAEQIHFRYRLDGYDRGWIEAGATRAAYYTHLPGGIYRFRMQAADRYGRWSHEAEVSIRLRPRFTETIWFKFLAGLALAAAAVALYAARMHRIRAQYAAILSERARIAREFHDTLAQSLVALSQQLHLTGRALDDPNGKHSVRHSLGAAQDLARQCTAEARSSLLDLRPEILERAGLLEALHAISAIARANGIAATMVVSGEPRRFRAAVEQNILRIAQEAARNATRHSGAKTLEIALLFGGDEMVLSIADDGSGPPTRTASGPLRLGLVGAMERARAIGAEFDVKKNATNGTTVRLVVPIGRKIRITLPARFALWSGLRR